MEVISMSTGEERLLRAIFAEKDSEDDDGFSEDYPQSYSGKAHYAHFLLHKSLENLSPALCKLSRLRGLLQAGQKDGKDGLPRIITNNESRMVLQHLGKVKGDVNKAYCEICQIFKDTKEPDANV
jgi:hypothetical protein